MKKVRSSQPSMSLNSSTELSKTQFFPLSIVEVIKRYAFHYLIKSFPLQETKTLLKYCNGLIHGVSKFGDIIF